MANIVTISQLPVLETPTDDTFIAASHNGVTYKLPLAKVTGGPPIGSFGVLQQLTRLGLADKVLAIGDQVVCEKAVAAEVTVANNEREAGITAATVDLDAFVRAMGYAHSGDYEFSWDGNAWRYGDEAVLLSDYGIAATGTPALGDTIAVRETASALVWDVIGIDCDTPADPQFTHSVTLGLHECFATPQFCPREALFYAEETIPAGTYNFTLREHNWVASDVGKTFRFTLTEAVPAGGQIVLMTAYNAALAGSTVKTYASASTATEIETATLTEGSSGTSLGDVDNAVHGNTNALERALVGSNNYAVSPVRQYINSSAGAGNVWTPTTKFSRPPNWAETAEGFLNGMDGDFLSVIGEVTKVTALNTVSDGGGTITTADRFFLLSHSEIYGGNAVEGGEGAAYPYYSENSDLNAPGTGADGNRVKYRSGTAQNWWLRSPNGTRTYSVHNVDSQGRIGYNYAYYGYGIAPACCIV